MSRAPGRGPARFPQPILVARLGDGSRVAICVPPASPRVAITVRRFGARSFSAAQLIAQGALPAHIRDEAERVLHTRRNILVSGGTASGNTTLLNVLIALIPDNQRIVAIEDTLELRIDSPNRASGSRRAGYSRERSQSATSCATPCGSGPITSSSAKCAAPKRPTCCKPSTPDTAARSPSSMRTTPTAPCPAWRAARMQGVGDLPWDVTWRGVVDGIALVTHMTRREGAAIRGRSRKSKTPEPSTPRYGAKPSTPTVIYG